MPVVIGPSPIGGWSRYRVLSAAAVFSANIVAGPAKLGGFHFSNNGAAAAYVRFYDKATAPVPATDVPIDSIMVPAGQTVSFGGDGIEGYSVTNGLSIYVSGAAADTDATTLASNQVMGAVNYLKGEVGYSA